MKKKIKGRRIRKKFVSVFRSFVFITNALMELFWGIYYTVAGELLEKLLEIGRDGNVGISASVEHVSLDNH